MSCQPIKASCTGAKTYAICVQYESEVNTQSDLIDETCLTLEETTQDIYNQLEQIDLSALEGTYTLDESNRKIVKNVLLQYETKIADLEAEVETLKNTTFMDISLAESGLDFECLTNSCDTNINTVKELFQALITKACLTE